MGAFDLHRVELVVLDDHVSVLGDRVALDLIVVLDDFATLAVRPRTCRLTLLPVFRLIVLNVTRDDELDAG